MRVVGTLWKLEHSHGSFKTDSGEIRDYDNVVLTIATDDRQLVEIKVRRSDLDPTIPLVEDSRVVAECTIPKGTKLGLTSIAVADTVKASRSA